MGSISASPRNDFIGALSDALQSARGYGNRMNVPYLGGVGDLLLGNAPDELNEWSYGNAPLHMPQMSNIPNISQQRAAGLLALAQVAPMAKMALPIAKGAGRLALEGLANRIESGAPEMAMLRPHYAVPPSPAGGVPDFPVITQTERKVLHPSGTPPKRPQYEGTQQMIPGLRALQGVEKVGPGMYSFDAAKFNDADLIKQLIDNVYKREAAEGATDNALHPNASNLNMLKGALEDFNIGNMLTAPYRNPNMRALLAMDEYGNPTAGASFDLQMAKDAMAKAGSLNFTNEPVFMPHLARLQSSQKSMLAGFPEGDVSGRDIIRKAQELYGNNIQFEVGNPKVNEQVYRKMGAKYVPEANPPDSGALNIYDGLLPVYEFDAPIRPRPDPNMGLSPQQWLEIGDPTLGSQQRLEGFKNGGRLRRSSSVWNPAEMRAIKNAGFQPGEFVPNDQASFIDKMTWPGTYSSLPYRDGGSVQAADGGSVPKLSPFSDRRGAIQQMTHQRSSSQMTPELERLFATNERLSPTPIGLEAPLFDPTDPSSWPVSPTAILKGLAAKLGGLGALGVVKAKGGNWLTGSVEDALKGLKREVVPMADRALYRGIPRLENPLEVASPINSFIDKQLTRYVKNEMATPEDPIRALAERGVLHFEPRGIRDRAPIMDQVVARRLMSGNPATERAVTPLGEQWGRYADAAIRPIDISELTAGQRGANQWVEKVPANTQIHQIDYQQLGGPMAGEGLGFNHLIDELSNAINPESGLPQHLRFPADRLNKVSVPQAVERVSQINAWRAAQKAEADALKANNAATVLHKEYPEKGMKWVELKQPDELPEGWKFMEKSGNYVMPDGTITGTGPQERALADALKYEGDTMGHCVGGYGDDVASGKSRIYSLRDAKGQPHTTIEVSPNTRNLRSYLETLPDPDNPTPGGKFDPAWSFHDYVNRNRSGNGDYADFALKALQEHGHELPPPRIVQIKGKGNAKPNDEYLPFVQDFVKSGEWTDVGDLENTGLRRTIDAFNSNELKKIQAAGIEVPQWATPEDIQKIGDTVWPGQYGKAPGMASGGAVRSDTEHIQDLLAQLNARGEIYYPKPGEPPPTVGTRG